MAHNGARAMAFLEDLKAKTERAFRGRTGNCWSSAARSKAPAAPALEPWDVAYYAEKQRAALYDFDEEALRPYFPLESVVAGLFELVEPALRHARDAEEPACRFGIRRSAITTSTTKPATFLGGFYADWYPRENKRGGAWMDALITGGPLPARLPARTWA